MKSVAQIILFIILLLGITACNSNPTDAVGDTDPTTSGFIKGYIADSISHDPVINAKIIITDIEAESTFADSVNVSSNGYFEIGTIYEKDYYLTIKAVGYQCRTILVSVVDTLTLSTPVLLPRNHYPFERIGITEFPSNSNEQGKYYQLNSSIYARNSIWNTEFDGSTDEVNKVTAQVDSIIISLLQNKIKPDTLWFKFWQPDCSNIDSISAPLLVVKLASENQSIRGMDFIPYNFMFNLGVTCIDSSETILRNSFFDL